MVVPVKVVYYLIKHWKHKYMETSQKFPLPIGIMKHMAAQKKPALRIGILENAPCVFEIESEEQYTE